MGSDETKTKAILDSEGKVKIRDDSRAQKIHQQGYFGTWFPERAELELEPEEALLLMERSKITIIDAETSKTLEKEEIVQRFVRNNPHFWDYYRMYNDLRTRGYVVRFSRGDLRYFRLYPRGAEAGKVQSKTIIYPLAEGKQLSLQDLDRLSTMATQSRKEFLLGLIDHLGDTTYYVVQSSELAMNTSEIEYLDEEIVVNEKTKKKKKKISEDSEENAQKSSTTPYFDDEE